LSWAFYYNVCGAFFDILGRSERSIIFVGNLLDEIVTQSVIIERILLILFGIKLILIKCVLYNKVVLEYKIIYIINY
jgi:hypothetical protein